MVRIGLSSFSLHLPDALGNPWYELDADGLQAVGSMAAAPTLDLLDMPAEIASHGVSTVDLCIQHIPSIERSYLAELRSAFEESKVELYQLLIDLGEVASADPAERSASIKLTKRWMEIAAELGSTGVRYVPGDSKPTPEAIRKSGEAFRELFDYCVQCGVEPATENYKFFNQKADDLLQVLDLSEREYGLVADFGNAQGPNKYDTLAKLMPRATAIHQWVEIDEDGTLNVEDSRHCLNMARDNGFDGPIMLLGGHPYDVYRGTRDLWGAVDELRGEVQAVFGEDIQGEK